MYITESLVRLTPWLCSVILTNSDDGHKVGKFGEQGWRSGESARLPPMWPGFESWRRRHMCVEFVVGSLPCSERFFSGYSGFPLSLKTNTFKLQFDLECTDTFQRGSYKLLSDPWVNKLQQITTNGFLIPLSVTKCQFTALDHQS